MKNFEDFAVGDGFLSPGRTITETDIVMFAGLTGDFCDIHLNVEAAKKRQFGGGRIAHGLLVLALTRGLLFRSKLVGTDAEVAFVGIPNVSFKQPVMIGDTIHIRVSVRELREEEDAGIVMLFCEAVNQEGTVTQESTFMVRVARRLSKNSLE